VSAPPIKPNLFYVLVKPRMAPKRKGVIILTDDSREAEKATNTVGQVIELGPLAYKTKPAGLDYSADTNQPVKGSWVRYAKHAGQPFNVRNPKPGPDEDEFDRYVLITDTDILGVIPDDMVDRHVGYIP
jgi:hypothetical protein